MKIAVINKSDSSGGAAVVSRRLTEALRQEGTDARLLVCEKLTNLPFVEKVANDFLIRRKFISERLKIFIANGFNRSTLFKIDTGSEGLPLWRHPFVKEADAIIINWVNQGMLSLKGVRKILGLGKPVIWTMHDMWCMTGICHHAGNCRHFLKECGECPLLGQEASPGDLSNKVWSKKNNLYSDASLMKKMAFVAVSNWLGEKSSISSLLRKQRVAVIPNAFKISAAEKRPLSKKEKVRILFGAARIDDPIKGLDTLNEMSHVIRTEYPDIAANLEIAMFGDIRNPELLNDFGLPVVRLGVLHGEMEVKKAYEDADILLSASSYETLPGTLVEAQAYGCIPVSFNQGGQADIITHSDTGYIAPYDSDIATRARNLSKGVMWALSVIENKEALEIICNKMRKNVETKFSYSKIAREYISLINRLM